AAMADVTPRLATQQGAADVMGRSLELRSMLRHGRSRDRRARDRRRHDGGQAQRDHQRASHRAILAIALVCVALFSPSAASAAARPDTATGPATGVDAVSATLTGTVDPHGAQVVDCHFEIAPVPKIGETVPCWQQVGAGEGPVAVSAPMIDLGPAVTYT